MKRFIKILPLVLILLLGFTETANMVTGFWYQQFLPNLNGRNIVDITFTDSLNGYAITTRLSSTDTSFILKTTNGGDNWLVNHTDSGFIYKRIKFINQNTGYVGGTGLIKTTNGGNSWANVNMSITLEDMFFINVDTGWCAYSESLTGGVFRTTNAGVNWTQQLNLGSSNPDKIYMFNARIGFISENNTYTRKTTNSGASWFIVTNGSGEGFYDMFFTDSLNGLGAFFNVRKTTNGGINWTAQVLPYGGIILTTGVYEFSKFSKDTIFAVGGETFYGAGQFRGIIYRTTNGGANWLFQVPDTSIHLDTYHYVQFINKNIGWAYNGYGGIHTINGGDTTFLVGVQKISNNVPKDYKLYQNYPNPFNPTTNIKYQIVNSKYVTLKIFDITGKEVITLVNQKQNAGTYQVDFSGIGLASGIYFYSLIVGGVMAGVKKMILLK